MWKLLVKLIYGKVCSHEFELVKDIKYFDYGRNVSTDVLLIYFCKKCGKVKKIKT